MIVIWHRAEEERIWWMREYVYDDEVFSHGISMIDGTMVFSFDLKNEYSFFKDYPQCLTGEELKLFNKENPFLAEHFGKRFSFPQPTPFFQR